LAKARARRPITVYECEACGTTALGDQRCPTRERSMAEVGIAGERPEPIALVEIVAEEITALD
jgi:hypothetical protein